MDTLETPRAVIDALGGAPDVSSRLKVGASAVSNWMKDGFPKSRIPDLLQIAYERGTESVTLQLLLSMEAKYPERPARREEAA